jgi:hypothetical protein
MTTYTVTVGTPCLVLIQEAMADLKKQPHETRKFQQFTDEHVLVDPMKLHQFGNSVYPKGSVAEQLASEDYMVFSQIANEQSTYMLAVLRTNVKVS